MQLGDDGIKRIISKVNVNDSSVKGYCVEKDRLYCIINKKKLWVVPKSLRWRIVHDCHDKAGHLGVDKTIDRIQNFLWFPRMRNFVKAYIKSCVDCACNKIPGEKKEGVYNYDDMESTPFKTVHLDHLGPFPKSSRRNEHILVLVDSFTKFTVIRAVKSTATKHVLAVLDEVISYIGVPHRFVTDRGTASTSKEFTKYCKDYDIKHIQNAVRTPRVNGHAERTNRTLLSMLRTMTQAEKKWDDKLRDIQWVFNTTRNQTTGQTPYELVYSFKPRDILKNKLTTILNNSDTQDVLDINNLRQAAAERVNRQREKSKIRFDSRHTAPTQYKVGDLVLAENEPASIGESRKLEPRYKGPFIVSKTLDRDRYVITDLPDSSRKQRHYTSIFSSDKLRPWCNMSALDEQLSESDESSNEEDN